MYPETEGVKDKTKERQRVSIKKGGRMEEEILWDILGILREGEGGPGYGMECERDRCEGFWAYRESCILRAASPSLAPAYAAPKQSRMQQRRERDKTKTG